MTVHAAEDIIYIHGGYSREKRAVSASGTAGASKSSKTEGVVHQDTWMLNMKPSLAAAATGGAGGSARAKLDMSKLTWQKVRTQTDIYIYIERERWREIHTDI